MVSESQRDRGELLAWGWVLVFTLLGGCLRIIGLSVAAIPGDELEVWRIFLQGSSALAIWRGEIQHPISMFLPGFIRGFADIVGLPHNVFALRLPCALLGTLTIPLVFLAARRLLGRTGGVVAAGLMALNVVHIQASREAYPYGLSMTGGALLLLSVVWMAQQLRVLRAPGMLFYGVTGLGLLFMFNASIAAWPIAALFALVLLTQTGRLVWLDRRRFVPLVMMVVLLAVIAGPQILNYLAAVLARGNMKSDLAAQQAPSLRLWDPEGLGFIVNFAWGDTWPRALFTVLVLVLAGYWIWRRRRDGALWAMLALLVGGYLTTMVSRYVTGNPFATRFLVPLLPLYMVLLAGGLTDGLAWPSRRRHGMVIFSVLCVTAASLLVTPALWAQRSTGRHIPYGEVVAWADAHLPAATPVLCHRFFDPWNEFRVNPATNAIFMSTVPNEPAERYQAGWRETAQTFLERNRDAVFYEPRFYWEQLGPWNWPPTFFSQKVHFVDAAYVKLDSLGLLYRPFHKAFPREWFGADIFYNRPDDVAARAASRGEACVMVFERGWSYHKTEDMRDWRVMGAAATLHVMNVTPAARRAWLWMEAVPPQKNKTVSLAEGPSLTATFPANNVTRVRLGPLLLPPGSSRLTLVDAGWAQAQVPLLLQAAGIDVEPEAAK